MSTTDHAARIAEIEARLEAATQGRMWRTAEHLRLPWVEMTGNEIYTVAVPGEWVTDKHATCTFIANAPADLHYMLARVRELEGDNKDWQLSFNLYSSAVRRASDIWRVQHPDQPRVWPDTAEALVVAFDAWDKDRTERDAALAELARLATERDAYKSRYKRFGGHLMACANCDADMAGQEDFIEAGNAIFCSTNCAKDALL